MFSIITGSKIFAACSDGGFLGFPTWYKYLTRDPTYCTPKLDNINDFWLIGLALIEILLRVAILAAIAYTILGGFKMVSARDNSDKVANARTSIIDALTGLAIAIVATALVAFIAGRFSG